jgi:hypothetical protein
MWILWPVVLYLCFLPQEESLSRRWDDNQHGYVKRLPELHQEIQLCGCRKIKLEEFSMLQCAVALLGV